MAEGTTPETLDSDEISERPVKRKSPPGKSRLPLFAAVIAALSLAWGLFEYRNVSVLTESLAQANARNAQLQQQVTNQTQELKTVAATLSELARKNLPVSILFRPTPSGNGLMTFFKNNAPSPVQLGVVLTNPVTNRRREVNLNIAANGLHSIGEAEGWVFEPGHHVQVTHAEFGTVEYVVPEKPQNESNGRR